MKNILPILTLIFIPFALLGQDTENNITVIKDSRIDPLIEKYKSCLQITGYKIQIHSGSTRQPAKETRAKFVQLYNGDDIKSYEVYQQPYFKIRVGNFRTKLEALKFLKKIGNSFPGSFIIQDEIDIKELCK